MQHDKIQYKKLMCKDPIQTVEMSNKTSKSIEMHRIGKLLPVTVSALRGFASTPELPCT